MNREDIIRMAREAGFLDRKESSHMFGQSRFDEEICVEEYAVGELVERFAALVAAHEREAAISKIESEIVHAEINGLRLAPLFGQSEGALAVRVDSLAAVIDAIRARGEV